MERAAVAGLILAAGKGVRMKSNLPKVLHPVCGAPMVDLVGRAVRGAGVERPVVVVHPDSLPKAMQVLGESTYCFALQADQLGTGHAALMARELLGSHEGPVLITPGDTPLLTAEALGQLVGSHQAAGAQATIATFRAPDPTGYGRLVRDAKGRPLRIVEHKDASQGERAIDEVNSAVYVIEGAALFRILPTLSNKNEGGEYYLTDVIGRLAEEGARLEAVCFGDPDLFRGVNDRWQLAEAGAELQRRILRTHALNGVTLIDPATTRIGVDVAIGQETVIYPFTTLEGATSIGARCVVGPCTRVLDSAIGDDCAVRQSDVEGATMHEGARCGPFAHLRPKAVLGPGARVGNFVEIKNATLADGAKANHLAYIGDASVGANANVGAGTITCNYDGFDKHRTEIGAGAFIGSNSTLVAPLVIGDGAFVAAGSTITENVPPEGLALGRARQVVKEQWAIQWRNRKHGT